MFYYLYFPNDELPKYLTDKTEELFDIFLVPGEYLNFDFKNLNKLDAFSYPDMTAKDALITIEEVERIIKLSSIDLVLAKHYCLELLNKYETIKNEKRTK